MKARQHTSNYNNKHERYYNIMIQEFGFGDNDTGLGDRVKRFKGEKGITYRLSYVWWPGMLEKDDFSAKDLAAPSDNPERLTPRSWVRH